MQAYRTRIVDSVLAEYLDAAPAVNITGARATGKTTTALRHSSSSLLLNSDRPELVEAVSINPAAALEGETPRLLDEWQLAPAIWSAVRRAADEDHTPGRFLLSGSAWPENDARRHSGAGRIVDLPMRPMSLWESGDSLGSFSFSRLVQGEDPVSGDQLSAHSLEDITRLITRGGWPAWIDHGAKQSELLVRSYLDTLAQREFPLVGGTRRSPQRFSNFVRAYGTLTAHPAPLTTVQQRLSDDGIEVGKTYASQFHEFASRMYLVEDQPPWAPARRSSTRLSATPKRHLVDPSLAAAAMGASHTALGLDSRTLGFLFESLVLRDLRTYSQPYDGTAMHYRSKDGTAEIDIVIELRDGRWVGIEVKLAFEAAKAAAPRLAEIAEAIRRPPEALLTVTPTGAIAEVGPRQWIVPVGLLGP